MILTADTIRAALPDIATSDDGGEVVLSPGSTEEVASALAYCNQQKLRVEIAGAGTKRMWPGTRRADVVLNTIRLTGVREHPWQDLTATVGAGTPWGEMQRVLAARNQFVALDPLWPETATVGGVLSANDSGAIRLRYGSARDLVIGMTIVLADGTIAKTGGKVVKNVAGYDLHKLMIGAYGTLAVITEVTFRLHPLPANRAVRCFSSSVMEPLARLVAAITQSHINPEAIQIRTVVGGFSLDIMLAAAPVVLREKEIELARMTEEYGVSITEGDGGLDVFRARELLFAGAEKTIVKVTGVQTSIPGILTEIAGLGAQAVGYPLGIVYASFSDPGAISSSLRTLVEAGGGTITTFGEPVEPSQLMLKIRRQFGAGSFL